MKKLTTIIILLIMSIYAHAQCIHTIETSEGNVEIELQITGVELPEECESGYVFNPIIEYSITTPVQLYTLQGIVGCSDEESFFDLPNEGGTGEVVGENVWRDYTDCGDATAELLECTSIILTIQGQGIPYQEITLNCEELLPIDLISFSLTAQEDHVSINWVTGEETPSRFILQHSVDAKKWSNINTRVNKGSFSAYKYNHYDYSDGHNYYRLVNEDTDGFIEIFNIHRIYISYKDEIKLVGNELIFNFKEKSSVKIYNIKGALVLNFYGAIDRRDISNLDMGVYYVVNYNTQIVKKIVKSTTY